MTKPILKIPKDISSFVNNKGLQQVIADYKKSSLSTGCESIDYASLYINIRNNKFKSILECGSGVSTVVMAYALYENYKDTKIKGFINSMEEISEYHKMSISNTPEFLKPYINYILSPCSYDHYSIFTGRKYNATHIVDYDFCFIDGPNFEIDRGKHCFCFDLVNVLLNATTNPVCAFIDGRFSTIYVMMKLLGNSKVSVYKKDKQTIIGIVQPSLKSDIRIRSKSNFRELLKIDVDDNDVVTFND
jgi:hypothetical protein